MPPGSVLLRLGILSSHAKLYMRGTVCAACFKDFHTRTRLAVHLGYMNRQNPLGGCLADMLAAANPMPRTEADVLDKAESSRISQWKRKGQQDPDERRPCRKCIGPSLRGFASAERQWMAEVAEAKVDDSEPDDAPIAALPTWTTSTKSEELRLELQALMQEWYEGSRQIDNLSDDEHWDLARQAVDEVVEPHAHEVVVAALGELCKRFDEVAGDWEDPDWIIMVQDRLSSYLTDNFCSEDPYVVQPPLPEQEASAMTRSNGTTELKAKGSQNQHMASNPFRNTGAWDDREQLNHSKRKGLVLFRTKSLGEDCQDAQHYLFDRSKVQTRDNATVNNFMGYLRKTIVILHLYSGRRRDSDVQCQLEWISHAHDVDIMTLSIDLAIHRIKGNLMNSKTVKYWLNEARKGRVKGSIAGPPCETWTVVREMQLMMEQLTSSRPRALPPPLRSRLEPWGLRGLEPKYYDQVYVSNALLFVSLRFTTVLLGTGGISIIEHPQCPTEYNRFKQHSCSIWHLATTRWLLQAPVIQKLSKC